MVIKKREVKYEIVRIVSMFFVISVHLLGSLRTDSELRIFMQNFFTLLFFTCNGMFYMLSGKFALQEKSETSKEYFWYYYKKFWGLIVPIILYMLLRYSHDRNYTFFDSGFITGFLHNLTSDYCSMEYWYLYVLVGNILLAPFIGKALQNTSRVGLWIFVIIGLFFNTMHSYMPLAGYGWSWSYPLESWSLYFYLGFVIDRTVTSNKQKAIVCIAGLVSILISLLQVYMGKTNNIYDLAPTFTCISCMMYILLGLIKVKSEVIQSIILFVSKHSFGIYMVHMTVLNEVVAFRPMKDNLYIEYLVTTTIIILIISLTISFIFDEIFIFPLKKGMLKLAKTIEDRVHNG